MCALGNPGLDHLAVGFDDMLAPVRQRQVAECLDGLERFASTRVALEIMPDDATARTVDYRRYLAGEFPLTANERHQLGFRLAARAGLPEIDGIDWHALDRLIPWERPIAYAQEYGQIRLLPNALRSPEAAKRVSATETDRARRTSVRDQLLGMNTPSAMAEGHRTYMDLAHIGNAADPGHADAYIGAEVTLRWYERNLMMAVNIARLARSPEERILVVVGAGHLPTLRHFLGDAGQFRLARVAHYLA